MVLALLNAFNSGIVKCVCRDLKLRWYPFPPCPRLLPNFFTLEPTRPTPSEYSNSVPHFGSRIRSEWFLVPSTPSKQRPNIKSAAFAKEVLVGFPQTYESLPTQFERFSALRPVYGGAVKRGLLRTLIHARYGGSGSLLDASLFVEEACSVDINACPTLVTTSLGMGPLLLGGADTQRKDLLAPFLAETGDPVCSLVHSEPGGTANWLRKGARGLQATARRVDDYVIVNAQKTLASHSSGWDDKGADLQ